MLAASKNPADSLKVILAALAVSAIGGLFFNVLPLYLGSAADSKSLSDEQVGFLGTAFFLGFNIAGLCSFAWARRVSWRRTSWMLVLASLALLYLSAFVASYTQMIIIVAVAGTAFGSLMCIGSVIIGDTSNPTRWYGMKNVAESSGGIVLMFVLPGTLIPQFGFVGVVWGMMAWTIALSIFVFYMPKTWKKEQARSYTASGTPKRATNVFAIICALLSLLFVFAGNSAIWAFGERMGKVSGFSQENTGTLLSLSLVCGIIASSAVAVVGKRFGNLVPFVISSAAGLVAIFLLNRQGQFLPYAIGTCLFMAGWSASYSLALAEIAEIDLDGRFVTLSTASIGAGAMIGPGLAGWLYQVGSPVHVLIGTSMSIVLSIMLMLGAASVAKAKQGLSLGTVADKPKPSPSAIL